MNENQRDITRVFLAVLFIGGLIGTSVWILRPFLGAAIWAVTIVTATWPLMISIQERLWGRRSLAVAVMTVILLCVLVVPLWLAIDTIVSNADFIVNWVKSLSTFEIPPPPAWIAKLPFLGSDLALAWEKAAREGIQEFVAKLAPFGGSAVRWFITEVGGFGFLVVQFLLTVVFAALLYARGEHVASRVRRFGRRLAGDRGEHSIQLAGQAVRGVALGVVVTALAQSILGGVGLFIAGVPFAAILTAVMFMLAIAQIGPLVVLASAVFWLYWTDSTAWGTFLLVWSLVVGTMDNFLRPALIRKGADLPLLLIFAGVVGGLIAFGLIGLFVGPVVLAVAHTLLSAWVDEEGDEGSSHPGAAGPPEPGAESESRANHV
ncbi:MAG: AI-2E family transporter YdiK [Syntrophobacteraceae bacterium]|jgi:predicted PurR-regulated permease PerM|nr:AI-2E family transporter YdiK [Syntrophobacteraceae bacterium]